MRGLGSRPRRRGRVRPPGASVRAHGRDAKRAGDAAAQTLELAPGADVRPVACDISSLADLHAFVERLHAEEERLDVLVNNAGVMPDERTESIDGVELTFATHVLAPWVLIDGLAALLARSAPGRVINVTSGGQYGQSIAVGDLESRDASYGPKKVYARTKRAQLTITQQWADELRGNGVVVHAMHPG